MTAVGLALVPVLSLSAWWVLGEPAAWNRLATGDDERAGWNILFVTLDTTRADRLGPYGCADVETPHLDRLARAGVVFEQAVSPAPLTLPAHASIFTGRTPPLHGVRDNGGFFLPDQEHTLAERFRNAGFRTGGFVGAYVLDSRWGIAQGFDTYVDDFDLTRFHTTSLAGVSRPGNEVVDSALAWLAGVRGSRFFAWVHLYDPHAPYAAPSPYRERYASRPYLGEIAFTDAQVGRLLDFLDSSGISDSTIVVVMGDHGESLGEHGEATHGFLAYQGVLRIPLIMRVPGGPAGTRIAPPVAAIDVAPTLLGLLGLPRDADDGAIEGRSLLSLIEGQGESKEVPIYAESWYPRLHFGWSELRTIQVGRFKYIEAPRPELYDLQNDPGETVNLVDQRRVLAGQLAGELGGLEQHHRSGAREVTPDTSIDPETRHRLAALGYIGAFAAPAAASSARSDPKDKIELFNLLTEARQPQPGEAGRSRIDILTEVTQRDPLVIDAWFLLGSEYSQRGDFQRALGFYSKTLKLKPDYDQAIIAMAGTYRQMGKAEAAAAGLRHYLATRADSPHVRYELAQVLVESGDLARAETELTHVLRTAPTMASARNALGIVVFQQGRRVAGEQEVRAALAQKPNLRTAHFNLALMAESRGDLKAAINEYRLEIAAHPDAYKAHFNLGLVLEQTGDSEGQAAAFECAIRANPEFAEGHVLLAQLYAQLGGRDEEVVKLAHKGIALRPPPELSALARELASGTWQRTR